MDRKTIEEIFKLGSDALYNTLNPDNGEVSDRYLELKEEAVKLFSIQLVSDMFSFAKYLGENYDYHDNTEEGDVYIHKGNKLKYTEEKIYLTWPNYR